MSFSYSPLSFGGGGGSGSGRTTVGASGATYQTITDALDAGANVLTIIADVTENASITVPSDGLDILINDDATLAMGTNNFNISTYGLMLAGNGTISYGNAGTLMSGIAGAHLYVEGVTFDNAATQDVCVTNVDYARFSNVIFDGDVKICGNSNIYDGCIYRVGVLQVASGINDTSIDGGIFESITLSDNGTNTVVSDIVIT